MKEGPFHLEDALQVDPSGDLPDKYRGQALGPQLLVHAQEVYLHLGWQQGDDVIEGGGSRGLYFPAKLQNHWSAFSDIYQLSANFCWIWPEIP